MKKELFGLVLGILIITALNIFGVLAEENITCSSNSDCGIFSTSFSFCKNETHICTTTKTPTCNNATTNISSCKDIKEETCWVCENGCKDRACLTTKINEKNETDLENETEIDSEENEKPACSTINKTNKCWQRKDCMYDFPAQTCQERPVIQKNA
jgi:hypothetical protein